MPWAVWPFLSSSYARWAHSRIQLSLAVCKCSLFIAVAFASGAFPVNALEFEPAMPVLRMYVTALSEGDCDMAWRLTSGAIKRRDKDPDEFRKVLCPLLTRMKATHVNEVLASPIAYLTDGRREAVFVPSKRYSPEFNVAPVTDIMYVVYSHDSGSTWEVLDLGCVDQRWVREVFPAYRGYPSLPIDEYRAFEFLP